MQIQSLGKVTPGGAEAPINQGTPSRRSANKVLIYALDTNSAPIWVGLPGLNSGTHVNCIKPILPGTDFVVGDEIHSNSVELDKIVLLGTGSDAALVTAFIR